MPNLAKKLCCKFGCGNTVKKNGYCEQHIKEMNRNKKNTNEWKNLYGRQWQREREAYLKRNPLCIRCQEHDKIVVATVVDHIRDHKGNLGLFWDVNNWQSLCKSCHDSKTTSERNNQRKLWKKYENING